MEKCYTVAETVKLTGVKSYVLRYWEDELYHSCWQKRAGAPLLHSEMIFNCF